MFALRGVVPWTICLLFVFSLTTATVSPFDWSSVPNAPPAESSASSSSGGICDPIGSVVSVSEIVFRWAEPWLQCTNCSASSPLLSWSDATFFEGGPLLRAVVVLPTTVVEEFLCILFLPVYDVPHHHHNSSFPIPVMNMSLLNTTLLGTRVFQGLYVQLQPHRSLANVTEATDIAFDVPLSIVTLTGVFTESFVVGLRFVRMSLLPDACGTSVVFNGTAIPPVTCPAISSQSLWDPWRVLVGAPLFILDLTDTLRMTMSIAASYHVPLTPPYLQLSSVVNMLLIDSNAMNPSIPLRSLFAVSPFGVVSASIFGLSLEACNFTDDIHDVLSRRPLFPQLRAFRGSSNDWQFPQDATGRAVVDLRQLNSVIELIVLDTCNSLFGASVILSGTTNLSLVSEGGIDGVLSISLRANALSQVLIAVNETTHPAAGGDQESRVAVTGLRAMDVSGPSPLTLSISMVRSDSLSSAVSQGRHIIDAFRTVKMVNISNVVVDVNDSVLVVNEAPPAWLCPSGYCHSLQLQNASLQMELLNLSSINSAWWELDLRGSSNTFRRIIQPAGLSSTEPVLLDAAMCREVEPCYLGSYVKCSCSSGSSNSGSGEPTPAPPLLQEREIWGIGSLCVAALAIVGASVFIAKKSCHRRMTVSDLESDDALEEAQQSMLLERMPLSAMPRRVQWSKEDEEAILCDANECKFMFQQYAIHPVMLGDGTTAKVMKVTRRSDKRVFAMKRYTFKLNDAESSPNVPSLSHQQWDWMEVFKEFWLLRHVDHPNIIHIEEVFISFFDGLLPQTPGSSGALGTGLPAVLNSASTYGSAQSLTSESVAQPKNEESAMMGPTPGSGALLPRVASGNIAAQGISTPLLSPASSAVFVQQTEFYPPESLTDHVTPFLNQVPHYGDDVITQHAQQQQNMSRRFCYIIMSYVPNGTLSSLVDRRREALRTAGLPGDAALFCEEEALTIGCQLYSALRYLHDPHRRRLLWNMASGVGSTSNRDSLPDSTGNLQQVDGYEAPTGSGKAWSAIHKPPSVSSQRLASSTSSFGSREPRSTGGHGFAQLLSEDGPILHRDVKPDNILIEELPGFRIGCHSRSRFPEHRIVLSDFGFADVYRHGAHLSLKGAPPAYAAPEVAKCMPSPASDVFSAGVVLIELLSATVAPVPGSSGGHYATNIFRRTFVEEKRVALQRLCVRDETIELVLHGILVADPSKRLTASEIADDILNLLQ